MKEILCQVHGNVQGVFFRQFISEKAREFEGSGTAENLPDGSVEVVAQGKEPNLRAFLEFVYSGSEGAEVESVNVQWGPATEKMEGFKIK